MEKESCKSGVIISVCIVLITLAIMGTTVVILKTSDNERTGKRVGLGNEYQSSNDDSSHFTDEAEADVTTAAVTETVTEAVTEATTEATTEAITEAPIEEEYMIPGSDSRYLTDADLAGLSKEELRIARNEIYARHGRKFKDQELQDYFNSKSWYVGTIEPDSFSESMLNEYEKANTALIKEKEK